MKVKKSIYLMLCAGSLSASTYYIKIEDNLSKSFNRDFDWQTSNSVFTDWVDIELPFNHTQYFPEISNQSIDFQQSRNYDQKQERYEQKREEDASKGVFKNIGDPIRHEQIITKSESRTINVSVSVDWTDVGSVINCTDWTPLTSTVASGEEFTQSRNCDQERTRTLEYYADSNLEHSNTETNFFTVTENQQNFGTQEPMRWHKIRYERYILKQIYRNDLGDYEVRIDNTGQYNFENDTIGVTYLSWSCGNEEAPCEEFSSISSSTCTNLGLEKIIKNGSDYSDTMYGIDQYGGKLSTTYQDAVIYRCQN